ncbi:FAD-dependent oxidoreductase [Legionella sp. WA2022007384]
MFKKLIIGGFLFVITGAVHSEKVAVVGAGASGLATAWSIGNAHEVTLIDKRQLGGHALTRKVHLEGKIHIAEAGAEFFNTTAYPHFLRLLEYLGVALAGFTLVTIFYNQNNNQRLVVPPVHDGTVEWNSFRPRNLVKMLGLKYVLYKAGPLVANKDSTLSLSEFLDSLWLTAGFKQYLYATLGAFFGVNATAASNMKAYYALRYMVIGENTQWLEATEGLKSYIDKIAHEIEEDGTKIETGIGVKSIELKENGRYRVIKEDGSSESFDKVVLATNAKSTARMLKGMAGREKLVDIINKVDYVPATIALHGDESFLPINPDDRKTINIRIAEDRQSARMTMFKHNDVKIYKTWVTHDEKPEPCYSEDGFMHLRVNQAYVDAQKAVKKAQGKKGLFFAGTWTGNGDSHEEAVLSGMEVAERIGANHERLAILKGL